MNAPESPSGWAKMSAAVWETWPVTMVAFAVLLAITAVGVSARRRENSVFQLCLNASRLVWPSPLYLWGLETVFDIFAWANRHHPEMDVISGRCVASSWL